MRVLMEAILVNCRATLRGCHKILINRDKQLKFLSVSKWLRLPHRISDTKHNVQWWVPLEFPGLYPVTVPCFSGKSPDWGEDYRRSFEMFHLLSKPFHFSNTTWTPPNFFLTALAIYLLARQVRVTSNNFSVFLILGETVSLGLISQKYHSLANPRA